MNAWAIAILIRLHLLRAEVAEAEALLAILPPYRDLMEKLGFIVPLWAGAALVKAEVALAKREFGAALTVMNDLLHDLRQAGIRLFLPDTLYLQGLALAGQGKAGDAVETLTQAQTEATALGSRRTLWPILVALSDLAAQRGATAEAAQLRRQAQEIIAYIADHAGTPELRASFLNQSNVRALHSS
jgi:hypothetical protein